MTGIGNGGTAPPSMKWYGLRITPFSAGADGEAHVAIAVKGPPCSFATSL